jgi:hypothetical protein
MLQKQSAPSLSSKGFISVDNLLNKRALVAGAAMLTTVLGPMHLSAVAESVASIRTAKITQQQPEPRFAGAPQAQILGPHGLMLKRALEIADGCFLEHTQGESSFNQSCGEAPKQPKQLLL